MIGVVCEYQREFRAWCIENEKVAGQMLKHDKSENAIFLPTVEACHNDLELTQVILVGYIGKVFREAQKRVK